MGTSVPVVRTFRGGEGAIAAALVAVALLFSPCPHALAADLTATSGNGLNVTGATTTVLPDTAPPRTAEESWLSGFHVSGFLSQTFGMW